jgi:hypothetical protein
MRRLQKKTSRELNRVVSDAPDTARTHLLAKITNRREECPVLRNSAEREVLRIALQRNSA